MTTPTPLDPAHRLIHARSAAIQQLIQPLGSRADVLDAVAYLIGYEGRDSDIDNVIEHITALVRLGYETAKR